MTRAFELSVVVPAYNEASTIAACVHAARVFADEVVVVDGGSDDGTAAHAIEAGARVLQGPRGRGPQLAAGAEVARGDVLLFLHADARLPPAARAAIARALRDPDVAGGNFYLRFVPETRAARLFTLANDLRRRMFAIYYGDSAIFVRRAVYARVGGFRDLPIFEDFEFAKRLERAGRTRYVRDVEVHASARRFEAAPLRTLALWTGLQVAYSCGVAPRMLARFYADVRGGLGGFSEGRPSRHPHTAR